MPFHPESLIFIKHTETDNETLLPIEVVRKGYFVKTYKHGYKQVKAVLEQHIDNYTVLMKKNNDIYHPFIMDNKQTILVKDMTSHIDSNLKTSSPENVLDDMVLLNAENVEDIDVLEKLNTYRLITITFEGDNDTYGIMSPDLIYESFSKLELSKMDIDDDLISSIEPIVMDTLIVK